MKRMTNKRAFLAVAMIVLLLTASVGGTAAFLTDGTDEVANVFTPADVTSTVIEPTWSDGSITKSNVTIRNTGNIDAYMRAAIVVTWQDANGNVLSVKPDADEYSLIIGSGWEENSDGYYYCKEIVDAGENSDVLITSCTVIADAPIDGYTLHVEVIGSAIQAEGWDSGVTGAKAAFDAADN